MCLAAAHRCQGALALASILVMLPQEHLLLQCFPCQSSACVVCRWLLFVGRGHVCLGIAGLPHLLQRCGHACYRVPLSLPSCDISCQQQHQAPCAHAAGIFLPLKREDWTSINW